MTPQQLKNSILQRAIEGRLVEQRPEEGTAKELLKEIQEEKARLVKEGKIKKSKALPPITEEEKPFDIPEGWEWVRLGDLCIKIGSGNTPSGGRNSGVYKPEGVPLLREQNIYNDGINYNGIVYISQELSDTRQGSKVYAKDLLLNITGGSIGRCAVVPDDFTVGDINQHILIIRLVENKLRKYVHSCICGPLGQNIINVKAVGARAGFSAEKCKNMLIPLPPITEQHRIVAKIEELVPLVGKYDKAYTKMTDFNTRFPEAMKKSLLQYAIQGKLVEQRANEGTAQDLLKDIQAEKKRLIDEKKIKKPKALPPITEDEIPFDIPDSWKWVRLGEIGVLERGSGLKRSEMTDTGKPCIRYGELYTTYQTRFSETVSHTSEEVFESCHKVNHGEIVMTLTGENKQDIAMAVTYEGQEEIAMGGDMTKWFAHGMNPLYLTYLLNSPYCIACKQALATGNIIVHISNDKLSSILLPIPTLAEQHRIVAKLEELLPFCDQLRSKPN